HRSEQSAGPATQALVAPRGPLLDAALEGLDGDDLESAEEAIVYAANAALVANRVPLDDADEVREQLDDARATLSLGLELLSGGDPARAEIARAEALLDEAEATLALLSTLGLSAAQLGAKAEEAGLGPAVVKASLAVRALIASQARGEPFSLSGATDEPREKPAGFDEKLDQQLSSSVRDDVGRRAADRLRSLIG